MYYTLGQRAGLGIGGRRGRPDAPWYVAVKDLERNVLVAVQGHDHPLLMSDRLRAEAVHWIAGRPPAGEFACTAKLRYRQQDVSCRVRVDSGDAVEVTFPGPQRAATPGQYAVFYRGEECLGGGVIVATGFTGLRTSREPALAGYN